jgi:hypothetical protein
VALLIGTDEAGYGPNLGPLIIAATAWQVPEALKEADLYTPLRGAVARDATDGLLAIADSKALYKPGGGLATLEHGVLSATAQVHGRLQAWRDAWRVLVPGCTAHLAEMPWCRGYDVPLPCSADPAAIEQSAGSLRQVLAECRISLRHIEAVALFPKDFNTLVERLGSKAVDRPDRRGVDHRSVRQARRPKPVRPSAATAIPRVPG